MTYSVHQPWDPLKVCVVGRSYPPEFYEFMENLRLRELFQQIAQETEEDLQGIIAKLEEFGVEIVRPDVPAVQIDEYLTENQRIPGPISMTPRDQMIMIGSNFFVFPADYIAKKASGGINSVKLTQKIYDSIKGTEWPEEFTSIEDLPTWVIDELTTNFPNITDHRSLIDITAKIPWWKPIIDRVEHQGNTVIENQHHDQLNLISANGITRIGPDLYFGSYYDDNWVTKLKDLEIKFFQDYRCHYVTTGGHIDGCFCPVKPGLIVSIDEIKTYENTFPGWEVVYLKGESWDKVKPFLDLKKKNQGRWWIKGHEYDDELIDYVETWLGDWVGYCEESVFDVNILVIDEKNVIVSGYNETAFEAFARHGVTAHICPFRHRYFWDGGIHCVTLDLHREGTQKDYFPERR